MSEHSDNHSIRPQRSRLRSSPGVQFLALFAAIVLAIGLIAVVVLLLAPAAPTISAADASSTSEAQTFATAQTNRQATHEAAASTSTALSVATESARAQSSATALAYANSTATASARATMQAPPTLTAETARYLADEAAAQATVQVVDNSARQVFGPSNGALTQDPQSQGTCDDTGIQLQDFVAEARLYNPNSAVHGWDYSIVFTNPQADDRSRYAVILDSQQRLSLRLDAPGYYVEDRNTTYTPVDLSAGGSNTLKVYVLGNTAHVFINNRYETTFDIAGVNLGNTISGPHEIMICTGLKDGDTQAGKSTRYDGLSVWQVP